MTIEEAREKSKTTKMVEARPFLVKRLAALGVPKETCKDWSVYKSYGVVYHKLMKLLGLPTMKRAIHYYYIWMNGVPLDSLKSIKMPQAKELYKQILKAEMVKKGRKIPEGL